MVVIQPMVLLGMFVAILTLGGIIIVKISNFNWIFNPKESNILISLELNILLFPEHFKI